MKTGEIRDLSEKIRTLAAFLNRDQKNTVSEEKLTELLTKQENLTVFAAGEDGAALYDADTGTLRYLGALNEGAAMALLNSVCEKASAMRLGRITASAVNEEMKGYLTKFGFAEAGAQLEYFLQKEMLGKTVKIVIDRPYGSLHPHIPDLECPYNFGYAADSLSGEGEFQDAYVIGPQSPLETFTGIVAGIIWHEESNTTRWIVLPAAMQADHHQILNLIGEEEQYYHTKILWA
ncbi:MAG: hypothetical protein K6A40_07530 [Solobacterium sp.]|nr:hypothetical protein [Solobacterium sp.]